MYDDDDDEQVYFALLYYMKRAIIYNTLTATKVDTVSNKAWQRRVKESSTSV